VFGRGGIHVVKKVLSPLRLRSDFLRLYLFMGPIMFNGMAIVIRFVPLSVVMYIAVGLSLAYLRNSLPAVCPV